jgi:hypothetical protein
MTHFIFLADTARPGNRQRGVCASKLNGVGVIGVGRRSVGALAGGMHLPIAAGGFGVRSTSPT